MPDTDRRSQVTVFAQMQTVEGTLIDYGLAGHYSKIATAPVPFEAAIAIAVGGTGETPVAYSEPKDFNTGSRIFIGTAEKPGVELGEEDGYFSTGDSTTGENFLLSEFRATGRRLYLLKEMMGLVVWWDDKGKSQRTGLQDFLQGRAKPHRSLDGRAVLSLVWPLGAQFFLGFGKKTLVLDPLYDRRVIPGKTVFTTALPSGVFASDRQLTTSATTPALPAAEKAKATSASTAPPGTTGQAPAPPPDEPSAHSPISQQAFGGNAQIAAPPEQLRKPATMPPPASAAAIAEGTKPLFGGTGSTSSLPNSGPKANDDKPKEGDRGGEDVDEAPDPFSSRPAPITGSRPPPPPPPKAASASGPQEPSHSPASTTTPSAGATPAGTMGGGTPSPAMGPGPSGPNGTTGATSPTGTTTAPGGAAATATPKAGSAGTTK